MLVIVRGIWQALNTADRDLEDHAAQKGVPAGQSVVEGNEIPYAPASAAKKADNYRERATLDPEAKCYLPGVPRATYTGLPFQIVQLAPQINILYEYAHATRTIYTNGSKHPDGHIDWWMGDSRGRWEGDSLVVDVTDFDERTWFDGAGNLLPDRDKPRGDDRALRPAATSASRGRRGVSG